MVYIQSGNKRGKGVPCVSSQEAKEGLEGVTSHHPTDPKEIVDCKPVQSDLEGIQMDTIDSHLQNIERELRPRELTREEVLEIMYGPLDLSKVKLSRGTLRSYEKKIKRKNKNIPKGSKHYNTRRLKLRIENYQRHAELEKLQSNYRQTLWGRYVFRRKKAKENGSEFKLTWEEFYAIHTNLGIRPGTDLEWWKFLGSDKRYSLQMARLAKKGAWEVNNIEFRYKDVHLAFAKDLISALPEPNENSGV